MRTDYFMVSAGDVDVPFPNGGYVNLGLPAAACINAVYETRNLNPTVADVNQQNATVADPSSPYWATDSNRVNTIYSNQNVWVSVAPCSHVVSCFNPNNFGIKVVIGPFFRYKKHYMPRDADSLPIDAANAVGSGCLVFGIQNGPNLQHLNYNGVHMDRFMLGARFGVNDISLRWKRSLSVQRRYLSVLLPPNGRYDFRVRIPGVAKINEPVFAADWQYKYRYTHCTFLWKAYSGVAFDSANFATTNFGAGPGWGMTQIQPAFCLHAHANTEINTYVSNPPMYFIDGNPRVAARAAAPVPKFLSQAIVAQPMDDAF